MYLVEQHIIKKTHKFYAECDKLSFLAKNMYNASLYSVKQHFFVTGEYLNYAKNYHKVKDSVDYQALPAKVANQVIKLADKNFISFFKLNQKQKKGGYDKPVRIPQFLHKTQGRFVVRYERQALGRRNFKDGKITLSKTNIEITTKQKRWADIKEVRIVPKNGHYVIELVYFKEEKERKADSGIYCGIDMGVNNLFTVGFNAPDIEPFIINGRPLKSINQYYNKELARLKSELEKKSKSKTSKKVKRLTLKRNNKVKDYLHKSTTLLVNQLVSAGVSTAVVGLNKGWKQDINIGKKNNQNFVMIPHSKAIEMLAYKLELEGIELIVNEESYTSKASFLDGDFIPVYKEGDDTNHKFSGYRKARGLYKSKQHGIINADLNGAYNILRKAIPTGYSNGIEGLAVTPRLLDIA